MTTIPDLEIHTIYAAGAATKSAPTGRVRGIALLTLLVSAGWLYVTWQPVWHWVEREAMIGVLGAIGAHTPMGSADAPTKSPTRQQLNDELVKTTNAKTRSFGVIAVWFGVTTLTGLWLTMSGAAGWVSGRGMRILGWVLAPLMIAGLGYLIWYVNREYAWLESILPRWVWPAVAGLGFGAAVACGFALNHRRVGLLRLGAVGIIFASVVTLVAIWMALRWGGLPADKFATMMYVKLFAIQSAYGWLLLILMFRAS